MAVDTVAAGAGDPPPGYGDAGDPVGGAGDCGCAQFDGKGFRDGASVVSDAGDGHSCRTHLPVVLVGDGVVVFGDGGAVFPHGHCRYVLLFRHRYNWSGKGWRSWRTSHGFRRDCPGSRWRGLHNPSRTACPGPVSLHRWHSVGVLHKHRQRWRRGARSLI